MKEEKAVQCSEDCEYFYRWHAGSNNRDCRLAARPIYSKAGHTPRWCPLKKIRIEEVQK